MFCFSIFLCGHGSFKSRFNIGVIQASAILLVSFFFVLACESDYSKATTFPMGQTIPMGDGNLRVAYVEETAQFVSGGSEKNLAVFLDCKDFYSLLQKQNYSARDLRSGFALLSLFVLDSQGKKYGPAIPLRERDYLMAKAGASGDLEGGWSAMMGQSGDENIVVLFTVPLNSHGFTIYINNPWPKDGQSLMATVDLGR
jgi:hypothetical protein